MIRFQCPSCSRPWGLANQVAGTTWTCPTCHARVNVPGSPVAKERSGSEKPLRTKPHKRKKSSAVIPVSPDAGFELLESTGRSRVQEPFIPVEEHGDGASSHTKIRKQLKKRTNPKGGSSVEIDHIDIVDSKMNLLGAAEPPKDSKPSDGLPIAMLDSNPSLAVLKPSFPPGKDAPVAELASSPAINVSQIPSSEMILVDTVEADAETGITKKKTKKTKRASSIESTLESHGNFIAAMGMVGVALLVVAIGGGISLWKKVADQKPIDQGPAIAFLKSRGALIEQDRKQPGEPVIGVVMAGRNVNNDEIIQLKSFPKLERLNLSHTGVNVTAIDYISEMKSLRCLDLNMANIGDGVTGLLGQLTNLEELYLNNTRVTDQGLTKLYGLKKLRVLGLDGAPAMGIELQQQLPQVKIIR